MKSSKKSFTSIDEYIATFPEQVQAVLKQVRATIRATAPEAQEKISYGIPTFTLHGKYLVYFAGWKNHISIYPIPAGDQDFQQRISPYMAGKGTLKFPLDRPLPLGLVDEMVRLHIAGNLERTGHTSNTGIKGEKK